MLLSGHLPLQVLSPPFSSRLCLWADGRDCSYWVQPWGASKAGDQRKRGVMAVCGPLAPLQSCGIAMCCFNPYSNIISPWQARICTYLSASWFHHSCLTLTLQIWVSKNSLLLLAQGCCTISCDFPKLPIFVNSPFIILSSVYPIWLHHLFPAGFQIDKVFIDALYRDILGSTQFISIIGRASYITGCKFHIGSLGVFFVASYCVFSEVMSLVPSLQPVNT